MPRPGGRFFGMLLVGTVVLTAAVSPGASAAREQAQMLVAQTFSAPFHVDVDGVKVEKVYSHEGSMMVSARVVLQKPNFIYMEYLEPEGARGQVLVDTGQTRLCFRPQLNELMVLPSLVSPLLQQRRERTMEVLFQNFFISEPEITTVLGRPAWVLSIKSKSAGVQTLKLWIDKETSLILKKERYDAAGALASSEAYTSIHFGAHVNKEALLAALPPAPPSSQDTMSQIFLTLQEMRSQITRAVHAPDYLPQGYTFQEGELLADSTIKLVYTNGVDIITLFQRPRVRIEMEYEHEVKSGSLSLKFKRTALKNTLVWGKQDRTFILMGRISLEDMLQMAKSIG